MKLGPEILRGCETGGQIRVVELRENPFWGQLRDASNRCASVLEIGGPQDLRTEAARELIRAVGAIEPAFGPMDQQGCILCAIANERQRQDEKWGADRNHPLPHWMLILGEEVGEAHKAVLERAVVLSRGGFTSPNHSNEIDAKTAEVLTELTHVAAVAVAIMECIHRQARQQGVKP